jgi:hypothetical protein
MPLALALASAALLAAGCGGKASGGSTSPNAGSPPKSIVSAAYKYSSCMRHNGVTSFPDPQVVDQPGQHGLSIHVTPGLVSSPSFQSARKACAGILPSPQNANAGPSAQQIAARVKGVLAFASCMRAHQVPTFPDPTSQGQLSLAMVSAAHIDLQAPAVQAAARTCVPSSDGAITPAEVERAETGGGDSSGSSSSSAAQPGPGG